MVSVERTFTVAKPPQFVVDYLKDFGHAADWDPGTRSCDRLDAGPVVEGSTWRNVSVFKGRTTELTYRLARLEPARLTFVGENKTATTTDDLTVRPVEGGTSITYHAEIDFRGLVALAEPFLRGEFERLGDRIVESMPRAIEGR